MVPHIIFSLGTNERFCVPLLDVVEITTVPEITAMPHQSSRLAGLVVFRGEVIAVGHFDEMIGFDHENGGDYKNMIVFRANNGSELIGLLVQDVYDIKHIHDKEKMLPNFHSPCVEFVVNDNSLLIQNINVAKMLANL